jgi:hypothetical protein
MWGLLQGAWRFSGLLVSGIAGILLHRHSG